MKIRAAVVDGVFNVLELAAGLYDFVRNLRRPPKEEAFPLSHKDAERIAEFGRNAGHESLKRR